MNQILRRLVAIALMLHGAQQSVAQVVFNSDSDARRCFERAKFGSTSSSDALETCNRALTAELLTREARAGTYVNRGILYLRAKEYDVALADFDAALKILPELGEAHLNRGGALVGLKRNRDAIEALNRAIQFESEDLHAAYFNRALAFEGLDELDAAYADLQTTLDLKPDFQPALLQIERFRLVESEA
ncbi:MAG: tetratricopeptide repeat protein [Pseudomonadota bacterium]